MELCPEGTMAVDGLPEGLDHLFEVAGDFGVHSGGVTLTLMGVPLSSTGALHR